MAAIDLNCDMGESYGAYTMGQDEKILDYVSSVNIACGFHAGDPMVMARTVRMAVEKGVAIGAHPGFPDLMGFGRRNMQISLEEARNYMLYQIGALAAFVRAAGGRLRHVKPHGALYNMAAADITLATALAKAVYDYDRNLIFVGLANSEMIRAAEAMGLAVAQEVFADRAYEEDGSLVSRTKAGAVIHDEEVSLGRVRDFVEKNRVVAITGKEIALRPDTICLHGDNEQALLFAKKIRAMLEEAGLSASIAGEFRRGEFAEQEDRIFIRPTPPPAEDEAAPSE